MGVKYCTCFVVFFFCLTTQVFAESVARANAEVELISDVSTISSDHTFWVGLRMRMNKGWHTYWRNSGDSGLPTYIQWDLPEGFGAGDIQWPHPKRFDYSQGLSGYGYEDEVILLTEIWPPEDLSANKEFQIDALVRWLSCEEICVPGSARLTIVLNTNSEGTPADELTHQLFTEEKLRWPIVSDAWQISAFDKDDVYVFNIASNAETSHNITNLAFFPYRNDIIDHSGKQKFDQVRGGYRLTVPKAILHDEKIQRIQGILMSPGGWGNEGKEQALFFDGQVD